MEPLSAESVLNHPMGWRYGYYELHKRICEWSKEEDVETLKRLHDAWLESLIVDYLTWSKVEPLNFEIRSSVSMNIFMELCMSHYKIIKEQIEMEEKEIGGLFKPQPQNFFLQTMQNSTSNFAEGFHHHKLDWDLPILKYTKQDLQFALLMLTEKLDQLPFEAFNETKKVLELLYTRFSMMMQQEKLDRDFCTFCSIYFHAIQRRLFYTETVHKTFYLDFPEGSLERCKNWIEKELCGTLPEELFEEFYDKACERAYWFPGDLEWFKYKYPDEPSHLVAPILDCFRMDLSKKYLSEHRISLETVLSAIDFNTHTGHCARIFIMLIIDNYFKNVLHFKWFDIVTIDNEMVEKADQMLLREEIGDFRYIVQFFSRFCVYHKSSIYVTDKFYETFVIWLILSNKTKTFEKLYLKIIKGEIPDELYSGSF